MVRIFSSGRKDQFSEYASVKAFHIFKVTGSNWSMSDKSLQQQEWNALTLDDKGFEKAKVKEPTLVAGTGPWKASASNGKTGVFQHPGSLYWLSARRERFRDFKALADMADPPASIEDWYNAGFLIVRVGLSSTDMSLLS